MLVQPLGLLRRRVEPEEIPPGYGRRLVRAAGRGLRLATGAIKAIAVCTSVDEMLAQVRAWNIPLRCFT